MSNSSEKKKRYNIPLWCKPNLSIEEAAAYSGIGMGKLYEMTESQDCPFVLWIFAYDIFKPLGEKSADNNVVLGGLRDWFSQSVENFYANR